MTLQINTERSQRREQASTIALDILRDRDILNLRPARIADDVISRYGVDARTARRAVTMACRNAGVAL